MSEWLLTKVQIVDVCEKYRPDIVNFSEPNAIAQAQLRKVVKRLEKAMDEDYEIFGFDYKLWQSLRKEAGLE